MKARATASVLLAAAVTALLAGCGFVTPVATQNHYDPSDGVTATVGDVKLVNVMVVTEDGETGALLMTAVNDSDEDITLALQYETEGEKKDVELELEARTTTQVGFGEGGQLQLDALGVQAGDLLKLYAQYGSVAGVELPVPVLDGVLEYLEGHLPAPVPTPDATVEDDEAEATETPAP